MRNRAKCKLCGDILESFHRHDLILCECGEISIDGGLDYSNCAAKDWNNFLRIDDENNEIIVKVIQKDQIPLEKEKSNPLNRKETIEMLETMLNNIQNLPESGIRSPISHFDLYSYLLPILSILKTLEKD
jgi:hypothetical protein